METQIKKAPYFEKLKELLEGKKKAAIFTHPAPDPDALGSMVSIEWLFQKLGIETDLFCSGVISHPQNRAFVNLLDPLILDCDEFNYEDYDLKILVDAVPSNAGINQEIEFDLVIDHHKDTNGYKALKINLKAGSACATVVNIIENFGMFFEDDNDNDSRVATALLVGIATDTENMMSDDTTEYEFNAWSKLFPFRDPIIIKQIVNFERPKIWVEIAASAVSKVKIEDGIGVVGLGIIPSKHRDLIADMAQHMLSWEDINTAVVFAIIDGDRIEGSVRSNSPSMSVPGLCEALGGRYGSGGGKLNKGAYRYELAGASIEEEEEAETKNMVWDLFNRKEVERIFRLIKSK